MKMKKAGAASSSDGSTRPSKRKTPAPRQSPEGEAEEEADKKWANKRIKSEPGVVAGDATGHDPSTISNARLHTLVPKASSAADALRRRRMASTSGTTPRMSTPSKHEDPSVVDCALKALAEVPLDDVRFLPNAIKTFTEDHLNGYLPASPIPRSQVPFVTEQLRRRQADETRIQQVTHRLRKEEAVIIASWLSATIGDRETIQNVSQLLLDSANARTKPSACSSKTPQPSAPHASTSMPSPPPSSSRTSNATGAGKP